MLSFKRMEKYYGKHVWENSLAHLILGLGFGILLTYPVVGTHPVRWGAAFLIVGLIWHIKAGK